LIFTERAHLLGKSPTFSWESPTSFFFLGDLEIPQKREAYIVAECCTHFPQLLVWKKKFEVGDEDGEGVKKNPGQICRYMFGILLNSFPN